VATDVTSVTVDTTLELQAVALNVTLTEDCVPVVGQRVDLRRGNGGYVTNARSDASGQVTFDVRPGVEHRVTARRDGVTWDSGVVTTPANVDHDFGGVACM
jgi:hypothetical protein